MAKDTMSKDERLFNIYTRLINGEHLNTKELADEFDVSQKSITRDFERIDLYLADYNVKNGDGISIENIQESNRDEGIYVLKNMNTNFMSRSEIIAVCKILMDSRGLSKKEVEPIIEKLIEDCLLPEDKRFIKELVNNERHNYLEPTHGKDLLKTLLELSKAIKMQRVVKANYRKANGEIKERIIEPQGVIFNEFYFYLAGKLKNVDKSTFKIKNDENPTIFRLDRIEDVQITDEKFSVEERDRFKEGEFRKKIQFMFTGELHHIKMLVKESNIEIIRDRIPNAQIKKEKNGDYDYILDAQLFGEGILIWLLGQGDGVKLIGPQELIDKIKVRIEKLNNLYS